MDLGDLLDDSSNTCKLAQMFLHPLVSYQASALNDPRKLQGQRYLYICTSSNPSSPEFPSVTLYDQGRMHDPCLGYARTSR